MIRRSTGHITSHSDFGNTNAPRVALSDTSALTSDEGNSDIVANEITESEISKEATESDVAESV